MRILAIESSGLSGSVAALIEGGDVGMLSLEVGQRSARALAPAIADLLRQVGWRPGDVQLVAVTVGPGSFTGLRVGVTTAKMFAYAVGASVLGVNTMEAISRQAGSIAAGETLHLAMDAQRQELYVSEFQVDELGKPHEVGQARLLETGEWLKRLPKACIVGGPAIDGLATQLPAGVRRLSAEQNALRASAVGTVAWERFAKGERHDLWQLTPRYYRRSAAEEKLDAQTLP